MWKFTKHFACWVAIQYAISFSIVIITDSLFPLFQIFSIISNVVLLFSGWATLRSFCRTHYTHHCFWHVFFTSTFRYICHVDFWLIAFFLINRCLLFSSQPNIKENQNLDSCLDEFLIAFSDKSAVLHEQVVSLSDRISIFRKLLLI